MRKNLSFKVCQLSGEVEEPMDNLKTENLLLFWYICPANTVSLHSSIQEKTASVIYIFLQISYWVVEDNLYCPVQMQQSWQSSHQIILAQCFPLSTRKYRNTQHFPIPSLSLTSSYIHTFWPIILQTTHWRWFETSLSVHTTVKITVSKLLPKQ